MDLEIWVGKGTSSLGASTFKRPVEVITYGVSVEFKLGRSLFNRDDGWSRTGTVQ